jgi:hypothetical protein
MEGSPKVFAPQFAESMKQEAEQFLHDVMAAVNEAPDGDWIGGSEERVRDRFGEFRKRVYEAALQARIDAAEAAFSPSGDRTDRSGDRSDGDQAEAE